MSLRFVIMLFYFFNFSKIMESLNDFKISLQFLLNNVSSLLTRYPPGLLNFLTQSLRKTSRNNHFSIPESHPTRNLLKPISKPNNQTIRPQSRVDAEAQPRKFTQARTRAVYTRIRPIEHRPRARGFAPVIPVPGTTPPQPL